MSGWVRTLKGFTACLLLAALGGCPIPGSGTGDVPATHADAWRFLTQATFGPDEANIQRVMQIGYAAWIDEQFAMQPSFNYVDFMSQRSAAMQADQPSTPVKSGPPQVVEAFFTRALTDKAQLRARLSFALSEIFVVSFTDDTLSLVAPEMVASFVDTLDAGLTGNYRDLLENVAKTPAMGQYLTYRGNAMEVPAAGRFPDENFAREIMQLFSIGLYELNPDGTVQLDGNGTPIETYSTADIKGLAKVFTGWGNYRGPSFSSQSDNSCFAWVASCQDPAGFMRPMVEYPSYHSVSAKTFLGITIAPQSTPSPQASLTAAIDRLATHHNTAPFISRQLIQRLVTSNPTPEYVGRVAAIFNSSGGNFKEVAKAILLDDEARGIVSQLSPEHGKIREPILRLTAILRAFPISAPTLSVSTSPLDSGPRIPYLSVGNTNDPATSFGQAPYYSPSVFNFFRPGYTPPQGLNGTRTLVAPELQLVNETSITGYFNAVLDLLTNGIGPSVVVDADGACGAFTVQVQQYINGLDPKVTYNKGLQDAAAKCTVETLTQRNVSLDLGVERSQAYDAATLVQRMADLLLGGTLTDALRKTVSDAISTIQVPALNSGQTNGADINSALDKRMWTAILMLTTSPEFLVTK